MASNRLSLLVLGLILAAVSGCEPRNEARTGAEAPELAVLDLDDNALKLADLRGKVVLVNFWLAECGPCLIEMPEFDKVYMQYRGQGFEVVAVNMGQDRDTVNNIRRRLGVSYPLVSDALRITTARYRVEAAPTSFLVDRQGVIRERINAPLNKRELARRVAELL